jgi:hypothetical protein
MALWECLGKVANIAGPVGVDMFKLIGMIVKGVETVRRNHEECQQLSHFASATDNLLHELANLKVIEHPKMWKPIQGLRGTLLQAYMLIKSCQHRSYAHHFCKGGNLAAQLQSVQKEMDFNIRYLSALLNAITYSEITTVSGTADEIRNAVQKVSQIPVLQTNPNLWIGCRNQRILHAVLLILDVDLFFVTLLLLHDPNFYFLLGWGTSMPTPWRDSF